MASIALTNPLPCQVGAFFCQASMQDAARRLGTCKHKCTGRFITSKLQRLMSGTSRAVKIRPRSACSHEQIWKEQQSHQPAQRIVLQ